LPNEELVQAVLPDDRDQLSLFGQVSGGSSLAVTTRCGEPNPR
jgi:hypothetical protein